MRLAEGIRCRLLRAAFEFSEHQTYIDVQQYNEGGGTYITFTDM